MTGRRQYEPMAEQPPPLPAPTSLPRRSRLVVGCAIIGLVYLAGVTNRWWPTADSALYLSLSGSLAEGEGFQFNGQPCTTVAPGYPLLLAGLRTVFGPSLWASNLFQALAALATLAVSYATLRRLIGPVIALTSVIVTACTYVFYLNGHRLLTDAPFALLWWLMLYAALRFRVSGEAGKKTHRGAGWLLAAVLVMMAALLLRIPGIVPIAALAVGLMLDRHDGASLRRRLACGAALLLPAAGVAAALYLVALRVGEVPMYARTAARVLARPAGYIAQDAGQGLLRLLSEMGMIFTAQRGQGGLIIGGAMLALAVAGMVVLWRRGGRLIPVVFVLFLVGMQAIAGNYGIRVRYLLPLTPMIVVAVLLGLCAAVRLGCQLAHRQASQRSYAAAVMLLAGLTMAANAPRVLRQAFYYSYLSHTNRYYRVIRDGKHQDVIRVAERVRGEGTSEAPIGLAGAELRTLHYLSGRTVVQLGRYERWNMARTGPAIEKFLARPDLEYLVWYIGQTPAASQRRLAARLAELPGLQRVHGNESYWVFRRTGPLASPASRPAAAEEMPGLEEEEEAED